MMQVVLLGAGMDSRPWRLELPPGVAWFEVDQQPVINQKRQLLAAAGAELPGSSGAAGTGGEAASTQTAPSSSGSAGPDTCTDSSSKQQSDVAPNMSSSNVSSHAHAHVLRTASWRCVAADLQRPGWTKRLLAAGFNPQVPTVWVLEGLLYYLEPVTVPPCLRVSKPAVACALKCCVEYCFNM